MIVPRASGLVGVRTDRLEGRGEIFAARPDPGQQLVRVGRVERVREKQLYHRDVAQLKRHRLGACEPVAKNSRALASALVYPTRAVAVRLIAAGQQASLLKLGQAWVTRSPTPSPHGVPSSASRSTRLSAGRRR